MVGGSLGELTVQLTGVGDGSLVRMLNCIASRRRFEYPSNRRMHEKSGNVAVDLPKYSPIELLQGSQGLSWIIPAFENRLQMVYVADSLATGLEQDLELIDETDD